MAHAVHEWYAPRMISARSKSDSIPLSQQTKALWILLGGLVLAYSGGVCVLSRQFLYGQGHAERPIGTFLLFYLVGWAGFAAATVLVTRQAAGPVKWILCIALLSRALLLPSQLVQESDCYRYVLDGEAVLHGVNPYAHTPDAVAKDAPDAFRSILQRPQAEQVLSRISYGDVPTIYPPLAQASFALGAWLTPWKWMGQRIVFLACDLVSMLLLLWLLRRLGRSLAWIVLYAWNPLILKEIANSAHVDSLVGLCLLLLIVCLVHVGPERSFGWAALAGSALAGAVLTKLYPMALGPLCLAYVLRKGNRTAAGVFAVVALVCVATGYLPFMDVGWLQLSEGLRRYGREWEQNAGAFVLLSAMTSYPRLVGATLLMGVLAWAAGSVLRGRDSVAALIEGVQISLLGWLLLLPAVYPWYAIGLLSISPLRPRPWAVVLSGTLAVYYLLFLFDYRAYPASWTPLAQAAEHGLLYLAIGAGLLWTPRLIETKPKKASLS